MMVVRKQHPIDRQLTGFSDRYRKRHEDEAEEQDKIKYKIRARRPAPNDYILTRKQEEETCRMEKVLKTL
jgi:hypothetical protein